MTWVLSSINKVYVNEVSTKVQINKIHITKLCTFF